MEFKILQYVNKLTTVYQKQNIFSKNKLGIT